MLSSIPILPKGGNAGFPGLASRKQFRVGFRLGRNLRSDEFTKREKEEIISKKPMFAAVISH